MKTTLLIVTLGLVALAAGLGLVVAADRLGWVEAARPETVADTTPVAPAGADAIVAPASTRATPVEDGLRAARPPAESCTTAFTTVRLDSAQVARRAGLRVEPVRVETVEETVACNAEVAFAGDRYARLASRAAGTVAEVTADWGDRVEPGDVLAIIDSSELGSARAAYLQGRSLVDLWEKNQAREQALLEKNVATEKDVVEAETRLVESRVALSSARQRLRNLGLSDDDIDAVAATDDTSSRLPLRAPFGGIVVERDAVPGEVVSTSRTLFAIADPRTMWVMLDVSERDVPHLAAGQAVSITVDAMPDRGFDGVLTWISAAVDPATRTIQARVEVENPEGMLRAHMFGRAEIRVRTIEDAVLVPASAVQWDGCCNVVFVRHSDTIYQPYRVTLGSKHDGHFVVEAGLPAGESVVTQGSFLLKTEILKGNIGAGCCEVDPGADR
jgi:cobalt-zinc-cadmium efflux system membrane fusion protein